VAFIKIIILLLVAFVEFCAVFTCASRNRVFTPQFKTTRRPGDTPASIAHTLAIISAYAADHLSASNVILKLRKSKSAV
jgi:hypothetical protein